MIGRRKLVAQALVAWIAVGSVATAALPVGSQLDLVALSGDIAPGTQGRRFESFSEPNINDSGAIAFIANLQCCGPGATAHSTGRGILELVAMQGSSAEPGGQQTFLGFDEQIDNFGRTMLRAEMNNLPSEFDAVWVGQQNQLLTKIAVSGQAVVSNDSSTKYFGIDYPHFGGGGILAGRAVPITNGHVSPGSDILFKSNGTELAQPIMRAGDHLNFLPNGVVIGTYSESAFDNPMVNNRGQIAVRVATVDMRNPDIEEYGQHLLLIEPNGTYSSFAERSIDAAPFGAISMPILNGVGGVAFASRAGGLESIWRKLPEQAAERVVRVNDPVPGTPGARFDAVFFDENSEMPIWISDRGEVAFWSTLVGGPYQPQSAEAVWIGSPGNLRPVIIEGQPAPGTGQVFASMSSSFGDMFLDMAVNRNSQVAVRAYFETASGDLRDGLFATDITGNLEKIVAYGDLLEVRLGDFRRVDSIGFEGDAQAKRGTGFNDRGLVTFSVNFADGTHAVFISTAVAIPEPTSVMLLLIAAVLCAIRLHRNRRDLLAGPC